MAAQPSKLTKLRRLYANGYIHAIPRSLCLVQAALVWAAAPMCGCAFRLFLAFSDAELQGHLRGPHVGLSRESQSFTKRSADGAAQTWLSVRASIDEEAEHKPKRLVLDPMYQSTVRSTHA